MSNKTSKKILWLDLEMTGLDPTQDRILEVGAIVTDWDFKELAVYEGAVKVPKAFMKKRMINGPSKEFWLQFPDSYNDLVKQNDEEGQLSKKIEKDLIHFIDTHFEKDIPVLLGGNSIHMDRRFIISEWKNLDARLNYRMLDVSAFKVVFEGKYGKKFAKPENHRAIDDIRGSIMELQYYLGKVKV
ncbi:MAG: oligoribonuclease [Candidatus Microsaccharimonas sossegonensis]|uniref:Oligoribonuclease n=1 Tax=Candidatus Microsaccharimonas sossegonensis TaxID=2506948 RepID=A0A4Q0AHH5_9BACT|nr:MAG: oligoribonuclease [Candidatus Microsaccharimonas sossegonensis]